MGIHGTTAVVLPRWPRDVHHIAALLAVVGVDDIDFEERAVAGGEEAEVGEELRRRIGGVAGHDRLSSPS